jgi:glycosyltransferase involved in cell wall biosynthesis
MKVLQLHAGYRVPAGEDTVVANEADALEAGGHDVRRHLVSNPTSLRDAVISLGRSLHNNRAAAAVELEIADFRPDIVHVHNTWFALSSSVVAAAARTGTPTVMTLHNYRLGCLSADLFRGDTVCTACVGRLPLAGVVHGCFRNSRILSAIAATEVTVTRSRRVLSDNVDRFVAPSRFMADRLVDIGVPAERLTVKPHFVSDPGARTQPPSASNEILYIGRLAPGKGLDTLMRAWERLSSEQRRNGERPLRLSIIGDGPLAAELREGAPRGIQFEGWLPRNEVMRRLLNARAFAFPSIWYEPFGMVLIEALSAGLPIVTSDASEASAIIGAPPELVVPVGNDGALATAMMRLSDAVVDEVGAANRHRYETNYTEDIGLTSLEELYTDVIASSAHGSKKA